MLQIRTVNNAIAKLGKIELVKANGYFFFDGDDVDLSKPGVYVYRLNQLTLARWVDEATERLKPTPADDFSYVGSRFHY